MLMTTEAIFALKLLKLFAVETLEKLEIFSFVTYAYIVSDSWRFKILLRKYLILGTLPYLALTKLTFVCNKSINFEIIIIMIM
jgi:hypothetical protein